MRHICNTCGLIHLFIPKEARPWKEQGHLIGFFWECQCGSTMFEKAKALTAESQAIAIIQRGGK